MGREGKVKQLTNCEKEKKGEGRRNDKWRKKGKKNGGNECVGKGREGKAVDQL